MNVYIYIVLNVLKTLHDKIAAGFEKEAHTPKARVRDIRVHICTYINT